MNISMTSRSMTVSNVEKLYYIFQFSFIFEDKNIKSGRFGILTLKRYWVGGSANYYHHFDANCGKTVYASTVVNSTSHI